MLDGFGQSVLSHLEEFVNEHFVTESGQKIRLAPYQAEFIKSVLSRNNRKFILLASTRTGKTEACAILATLIALIYDGEEVCIVAPTFKQAERMFKRIMAYFRSNKSLYALVDTERSFRRDEINCRNGSVLRCVSASNPESLLGFGATTLIVDEAGSIDDATYKTRVLRMIASAAARDRQPILVLIGTPHRMNHFYSSWLSDEFVKFRVTWEQGVKAGILDQTEVDYARSVMTDTEFKMWWEAEFISGETGLFDRRRVKSLMVGRKLKEREDGYEYFAGLDIARLGLDESVYAVVRIREGVPIEDAVAELVFHSCRAKRPLSDIIGWAKTLTERWQPRRIGVDALGMGAAVYDVLKEKLGDRVTGINLVGKERTQVYMTLAEMIDSNRIMFYPDDKLEYQFGSFGVQYTSDGKMRITKNPRINDDVVDALAFAVYVMREERTGEFSVFEPILKGGI